MLVMGRAALIFRRYSKVFLVAALFILNFNCRTAAILLLYCITCSTISSASARISVNRVEFELQNLTLRQEGGTSQKTRNQIAGMATRM